MKIALNGETEISQSKNKIGASAFPILVLEKKTLNFVTDDEY